MEIPMSYNDGPSKRKKPKETPVTQPTPQSPAQLTDEHLDQFMKSLKHKKPEPPQPTIEDEKPIDPLTKYVVALMQHFKSKGGGIVKLAEFVDALRDQFPAAGPPDLVKRIQPGVEVTREFRNTLFASVRAILQALGVREWGHSFPPVYLIPKVLPALVNGKVVATSLYDQMEASKVSEDGHDSY